MAAMLDPEDMVSRLPTWLRIVLVGVLVVLASGAGLLGYRYFTQPTTLTVAAGSSDGEAQRIMSAIASRLAKNSSSIRLKIVESGTALEAAKTFAAGKVDLAIVRADAGDLAAARTVVLVTHGVVMIIVPAGSTVDSMEGLKGKTVGVLGGEVNHRIVEVLTREYDLARAKVQFKDVAPGDAQQALRAKQVSALLIVVPIAEKYLAMVRNLFAGNAKHKPGLIAIESAGAIANVAQAYESYDLPKGTLRGSPPIPDDDLTTLRVPFYLVANKKLDDDVVGELTKTIMDSRRDLLGEFPLLAQVAAPSTDKDAFIPIHPGAAAFFDGTQQDFFDKYSNALYYGPMLLGGLASLLAAIWKFVGSGGNGRAASPLDPLYALAGRIRAAQSEDELATVEEELDNILKLELTKYAKGNIQAADAAALSLAAHRLEHLIDYRRNALTARPGAIAAE
jgi:TRAP transporter TAXI family solute receptor